MGCPLLKTNKRGNVTSLEDELATAITAILLSPYGCSLCDCGKSRNPIKGHQPDCPYELARATLAEFYAASSGHLSQDSLMSSLKLWMVGWRDDLNPDARAQMEEIIKYYDKSQVR